MCTRFVSLSIKPLRQSRTSSCGEIAVLGGSSECDSAPPVSEWPGVAAGHSWAGLELLTWDPSEADPDTHVFQSLVRLG